ncbi:MAG: 2-octaprenyl-6-methoxyphenyl hydroxylase [Alphaproteobacteria bacterium]|nr:2-octaprenyl-6-methoxyphenyl hydroxylase [Alphaproteobacteria bacterium]
MTIQLDTEVIIVGAGLTGATLACGLAAHDIATVVIDRIPPADGISPTFDGRASAIAQSSRIALDGIGLWPLVKEKTEAIREIRVSDGPSLMFLHYDHADIGDEPLGYMIENRDMRAGLVQLTEKTAGLTIAAPAEIVAMNRDDGAASVTLKDGRTITGHLIVAADGRGSATRQAAGIDVTGWGYNQNAIVATIDHTESHQGIAHERFLTSGPFAILPLKGGHQSSLVWTERSTLADSFMALDDDAFLNEISERVGGFLGKLALVGPRFQHPLGLQVAKSYASTRLALVGDAAHGIHPIAGQGLNLGLRDAAALIDILVEAKRYGLDLAHSAGLEKYQRWRRADNLLMAGMTDVLNRLFSNDVRPLKAMLDVGLATVNSLPPLKKTFMRHAMGQVGDLPKLMRGESPG